jgi:hypothetical protein
VVIVGRFDNSLVLDIVFVVYMYQRWAYRVDHKRTNEFGQSFENEEENNDDASASESIESKKDQ